MILVEGEDVEAESVGEGGVAEELIEPAAVSERSAVSGLPARVWCLADDLGVHADVAEHSDEDRDGDGAGLAASSRGRENS